MEGLYWRSFAFIRGSSSQKGFFADFDSTPTPNADIANKKGAETRLPHIYAIESNGNISE